MYRFIKHLIALVAISVVATQCTELPSEDLVVGEQTSNTLPAKVINTSAHAAEGSLIVKFDETAALSLENGSRSSGVTRSGIDPLNATLLDIKATSIERVFPVDIRHEERTRKAGLHRWYIVHFDREQQLESVARALAEVAEIEKIEFNTMMVQPTVTRSKATLPNGTTRLTTPQFNDPMREAQWDLHNLGKRDDLNLFHAKEGMDINLHEAWKYTTGDNSIIVAIMDQGVDYTHEDLAANMWVNEGEIPDDGIDNDNNGYIDDIHGFNHVTATFDKQTQKYGNGELSWNIFEGERGDNGHGTHVAGTIAAVNNNGIGINGIAGGDGSGNGVRIMSSQIFSGYEDGTSGDRHVVAQAFKYAADNGAAISNNSWGTPPVTGQNDSWFTGNDGGIQHEAIEYFRQQKNHPALSGGLVIFAAGNDGSGQASYPGAYRNYICVTSFGIDGLPASYTNYGPGANISAPGGENHIIHDTKEGILSTVADIYTGEPYVYYYGTSMACPHVTGVAALGLAYAHKLGKSFSLDEFTSMILLSVNDMEEDMRIADPASKYLGKMGTGRIDAFRMLMNVEGITCIPVTRGKDYYKIDMKQYISDGAVSLSIVDMTMSDADKSRLGVTKLQRASSTSNIFLIHCTNTGSAIVDVKMIAGGKNPGSNDAVGGMVINKKFALVVRDGFAENGGWM